MNVKIIIIVFFLLHVSFWVTSLATAQSYPDQQVILVLIEESPITGPVGCPQDETWLYRVFNGVVPNNEVWAINDTLAQKVFFESGATIETTKDHWHCHHWGEITVNGVTMLWQRQFRYSVIRKENNIGVPYCDTK